MEVVAADPTDPTGLVAGFVGSSVKVSWFDSMITVDPRVYGMYALWAKVDGGAWKLMGNNTKGYVGDGEITVTFAVAGTDKFLDEATIKYEFCLTNFSITAPLDVIESNMVSAIVELGALP